MQEVRINNGNSASPFWGGFMGFVPFEVGLGSIAVPPPSLKSADEGFEHTHDMLFAFIHRSIVFDHNTNQVHVQSLLPGDAYFLQRVQRVIQYLAVQRSVAEWTACELAELAVLADYTSHMQIYPPDDEAYRQKVRQCQELIRAGESYELCLTAQTIIKIPRVANLEIPWLLYKRLRSRNPAPFGAFLRLGPATILSSSPERFLSWNRRGVCQMRPIKGTVQVGNGMTQQLAEEILQEPKERAENLMILDLIRHDLHGILGPGNVSVTGLMSVERYRTVWQLVSVIEGRFPAPKLRKRNATQRERDEADRQSRGLRKNVVGLDLLKGSLPPGSMTGAPKKRSCELLKSLEGNRARGIYSGVMGYLCVGGGGDFSVVIRTAFKWDDPCEAKAPTSRSSPGYDIWRIGAGGAITALSNEQAELKEMHGKLQSTLAAFNFSVQELNTSKAQVSASELMSPPRLLSVPGGRVPIAAWRRGGSLLWSAYASRPKVARDGIEPLRYAEFMAEVASVYDSPASTFPDLVERIYHAERDGRRRWSNGDASAKQVNGTGKSR
jgi:para-aminobenzoate synthetase